MLTRFDKEVIIDSAGKILHQNGADVLTFWNSSLEANLVQSCRISHFF
jgi:hypothetical protein